MKHHQAPAVSVAVRRRLRLVSTAGLLALVPLLLRVHWARPQAKVCAATCMLLNLLLQLAASAGSATATAAVAAVLQRWRWPPL
jgi:hypothetical protein